MHSIDSSQIQIESWNLNNSRLACSRFKNLNNITRLKPTTREPTTVIPWPFQHMPVELIIEF